MSEAHTRPQEALNKSSDTFYSNHMSVSIVLENNTDRRWISG